MGKFDKFISTIGAVASIGPPGPPDHLHNQQTQYRNYGGPPPGGSPATDPTHPEIPPDQQRPPESLDPLDQETEPTPWYRKPAGLIAWIIAVAILIGLIVYGIMELIGGGEGTTYTPSTSATPTTTTTTPPAATNTEPSTTPPSSSAVEPPAQQPTQEPTLQPTQQQPTHRRHLPLPRIPSVITIPGMPNPVTLPPGLPY
jgi:hypothetical protein